MKFIVDSMLGKLAKWLRILGYDTLYQPYLEDYVIINYAISEERIVLTRDTKLIDDLKLRGIKCVLIKFDRYEEQLKQLIEEIDLKIDNNLLTRCSICNVELKEVRKEQVRLLVPPYVYKTQEEFFKCPNCNRIYWAGTHYENIKKKIEKMK